MPCVNISLDRRTSTRRHPRPGDLKMTIPRRSIRNKLILSTLLPVTAVFALLFWLGVSHARAYDSDDARHMLSEHARHQASRLALVLS